MGADEESQVKQVDLGNGYYATIGIDARGSLVIEKCTAEGPTGEYIRVAPLGGLEIASAIELVVCDAEVLTP